jgi:UDP-arabinose 4-epimerase
VRVLVTGGAGYIGSHTCKALAAAGHTPIVYDNLRTGHAWAVKWGPLEHGDINDLASLSDAMRRHRPDAVINFAALAYVGESVARPDFYYQTNVAGMITLLQAMRLHDVGTMVLSSSCATYGIPARIPIVEDTPQGPINPYGRSKRMAEEILRDVCVAYGLGGIALRYFNAAGADPEGDLGEEHDPETHLIPLVLQTAAGWRPHLSIFGTDYETPDGTCIRDYIHVADLASAHVAALSKCRSGEFSAYNLGTGRGSSIAEVIACARAVTGKTIVAQPEARRPGDPPALVADAAQARKAFGWSPTHSDLENVIKDAWAWMTIHRARVTPGV